MLSADWESATEALVTMPDETVARLPMLILVGGPSGCGKSTLARLLGDKMGVLHISRDAVKAAIAVSEARREADGRPDFDVARSATGGDFGLRAFGATYAPLAQPTAPSTSFYKRVSPS